MLSTYQNIQSLRSAVYRRGQPAWSRADHDQVIHGDLRDARVKSEARGRFGIAGIPQHDVTAADQHRYVRHGYRELVKDNLDIRIDIYIEIRVRMAVAPEERSQTQSITRMAGPD